MAKFEFDVFLCHNSKDKPAVIEVAEQLKQRQIKPWLDIWELPPGRSWQASLEQQIDQIGAAAVFVGSSGFGPWQSEEIKVFLREFVSRQCPVIPVLLSDAPEEPQLPLFLRDLIWVDFRIQQPDPMGQLIWGITGIKPETLPIIKYQSPRTLFNQKIVFLGDISQQELESQGKIQPKLHNKTLKQPAKISKKLPHTDDDDLSSEKGVDYTKLRSLLAANNWKEADRETYLVMIRALGKKDGDWFTTEELLNFPCIDLRTIDGLWVKHSNGKFGFSVQKNIYLSVGGKSDGQYYEEVWNKFGDKVGWRNGRILNKEWIRYTEVIFTISSNKGHLPILFKRRGGARAFSHLTSRLVNCNI